MVSIDYTIIAIYFMIVIGLGFWYQKRASKNLNSYFMAGKISIGWPSPCPDQSLLLI